MGEIWSVACPVHVKTTLPLASATSTALGSRTWRCARLFCSKGRLLRLRYCISQRHQRLDHFPHKNVHPPDLPSKLVCSAGIRLEFSDKGRVCATPKAPQLFPGRLITPRKSTNRSNITKNTISSILSARN